MQLFRKRNIMGKWFYAEKVSVTVEILFGVFLLLCVGGPCAHSPYLCPALSPGMPWDPDGYGGSGSSPRAAAELNRVSVEPPCHCHTVHGPGVWCVRAFCVGVGRAWQCLNEPVSNLKGIGRLCAWRARRPQGADE